MLLGCDHVRVRVPATSANLGPGFDALGLALGHYDEIEVRALASADVRVEVEGEGSDSVPRDASHLIVRALRAAIDLAGAPQTGIHLRCVNTIPHGRGMGSSAAAVVAGIVAARAMVADPAPLDDQTVLQLATEFEGHPDNAAPALLGGVTIAWESRLPGREGAHAVRADPHPSLEATVLVPPVQLATRRARGVLPDSVPHIDAAFNAGRSALLVAALTGEPALLLDATEDRLHQQYRSGVLGDSLDVIHGLRERGIPATVSGAGPTVLILDSADRRSVVDAGVQAVLPSRSWQMLRPPIDADGARAWRLSR